MRKTLFIFLLGMLFFDLADAQKKQRPDRDTLIAYLSNAGYVTPVETADYSLFIMPNDPGVKNSLHPIVEFYPNGKRKLIGSSHTYSIDLIFEGTWMSFYPNGHRKKIMTYEDGKPTGDVTEYYPNGKLYAIKKYNEQSKLLLIECRDSTGNILAENGNGNWITLDENFTTIRGKGILKDSLIKGPLRLVVDTMRYTQYDLSNKTIEIIKPDIPGEIRPQFNGGYSSFIAFLTKNVHHLDFDHNFFSTIYVSFDVETNGTLTNIRVKAFDNYSNEVLRVMKLSPPWIPGKKQGVSIKMSCTVPIDISFDN